MSWIDNSLGVHAEALVLRGKRAEILAGNISNADTPNYKARDIDFGRALEQAGKAAGPASLRTTHSRHIGNTGIGAGAQENLVFRDSTRYTPDGNTVQTEVELAAYTENAIKFQASAQFLDGTLRGLRKALRGE